MDIAAFFDFDETLLELESSRIGFEWLKNHRMMTHRFLLKIITANIFYRLQLISEQRMVEIMLTYYRNKKLADFEAGAESFFHDYLKPHLAPAILSRVNTHKKRKHRLVLISGSVRYLLEPVAKNLGFHHLLSTDLEVGKDGFLTGKPKGSVCVGQTKKKLALKLADRVGIDIKKSFAYGNHPGDIPLLESVGYPHTVEPTGPLKKIARQRAWPILSFR